MKITKNQQDLSISSNNHDKFYYLDRDIHLFTRDETAQILDFRRGQFYGLDSIAAKMLSLTLEKGFEEAITAMTDLYDAPAEQIRADLTELLNTLIQKKLLVTSPRLDNATNLNLFDLISIELLKRTSSILRKVLNPQPDPNPYTVELLLSLSWISFRLLGWSRSIELWQHWHYSTTADIAPEILQRVDLLIREAASAKLFLPVVCKERALVGYHLLRTFYGFPATLAIGINNYPFQIHAWVECNGLVITDDVAHCELFTPVVKYS